MNKQETALQKIILSQSDNRLQNEVVRLFNELEEEEARELEELCTAAGFELPEGC